MEMCVMNESIAKMTTSGAMDVDDEVHRRLCQGLRSTPEQLALMAQCARQVPKLESSCRELTQRCAALEKLLDMVNCPANMNVSAVTVDRISKETQVNVSEIVKGLGGDYVEAYPVPPKKKIRLVQKARPGYSPKTITIALNLANDGKNHLDIAVRLYVTTDPRDLGEGVGGEYRGFQFFNNDGIPTPQPFPTYKNMPMTIGTLEYLVIEIEHQGSSNNLVSAFAAASVNAQGWYAACGTDGACR